MQERLVALIAHLVTSGLDVETAIAMGRLYVLGSYFRGVHVETARYALHFPKEVERMRAEARTQAEEMVAKAILPAWIETERLRKAEKSYTQGEVLTILKPFALSEKDLWG